MKLGIDLGGTKIEAAVVDENGKERARIRVPTPRGDYEGTLQAIEDLISKISQETDLPPRTPVGIGTPGTASRKTGLIKNSNSVCLIGKPLAKDLETKLKRPVRLANDANCFVLSEATDGAASGASVVFGVILGTGVGGGLVIDRHIIEGINAIAGEWGHNPLPWPQPSELPGPPCYCGKKGCIETFLSGPALARDGGAHNEQAMEQYEDRLARALATVINIVDPEIIVLGGGVSNNDRLYKNVPRLWGKYIFSDTVDTKLVKHRHGDSSGVRGAAWLF